MRRLARCAVLLALFLVTVFLWRLSSLSTFEVEAQTAPATSLATSAGNPNIGPHEAGNNPAIADKVASQPVVIIVHAGEEATWQTKYSQWSSASPLIVRITGVTVGTTPAEAAAMGAAAVQAFPQGTIVVFGNELNNLDLEWKSRAAPSGEDCKFVATNSDVSNAANLYVQLFSAFADAAVGIKAAPAPADMTNACYSGTIWMNTLKNAGSYDKAGAIVANAYELSSQSAQGTVDLVAQIAGKPVDFLTEFGPDPKASVFDHLKFLNATKPPNNLKAATLVPNHCGQPVDVQTSSPLPAGNPWLYYVKGQLYNQSGQAVQVTSGNACNDLGGFPPVFITPEANETDIEKYLANSQVYCAPPQAYDSKIEGTSPTLGPPQSAVCVEGSNVQAQAGWGYPTLSSLIHVNDGQCDPAEYPTVEASEKMDFTKLSFPLFRNDAGGISIEADLSRVNPTDTFAQAALRNSKPNYAPQFYLTSPEMSCQNAVNHLKYIEQICNKYALTHGTEGCPLNPLVQMGTDGAAVSLLSLKTLLPDTNACSTISKDLAEQNDKGMAVEAISTQTPKAYKLAFFVQHTYMHEPRHDGSQGPVLQDILGTLNISTWFGSGDALPTFPGEAVDIVPVWYNSGLALSAYDQYLKPDGTIQAYNYDPTTLPQYPAKTDPSTLVPATDKNGASNNFISGWNQTYAAILPLHIQQRINANIRDTISETWALLEQLKGQVGRDPLTDLPDPSVTHPIIECVDRECLCYGASNPAEASLAVGELASRGVGPEYISRVANSCPSMTMQQVASSFPSSFTPPDRDFMYELKNLVIARVNAGVEQSVPFDASKTAPADYKGPLGERSFLKCPLEQVDYGVQEGATTINSSGFQQLSPTGAAATQLGLEQQSSLNPVTPGQLVTDPRKAIGTIVHDFIAKINPTGAVNQVTKEKMTARSYLILPDEALTIEKTQAYVAPALFSPEMYASIMSGNNPIYPFNQAGAKQQNLSAFLKADGVTYTVDSKEAGYAIYQATVTQYSTSSCSVNPMIGAITGSGGGSLGPVVSVQLKYLAHDASGEVGMGDLSDNKTWVAFKPDGYEGKEASCGSPFSIKIEQADKSTVNVDQHQQDNPNPQTPGQLAALTEYLRRMAFLPLNLVQKYTGLENFYAGFAGGTTAGNQPISHAPLADVCAARTTDLSKYQAGGSSNGGTPAFDKAVCDAASRNGQNDPLTISITRAILEVESSTAYKNSLGKTFACKPNDFGAFSPMGIRIGKCAVKADGQNPDINYDICDLDSALDAALSPTTQGAIIDSIASAKIAVEGKGIKPGNPDYNYDVAEVTEWFYATGIPNVGTGPGSFCGTLKYTSSNYSDDDGSSGVPQNSGGHKDYCGYVGYLATQSYADPCN